MRWQAYPPDKIGLDVLSSIEELSIYLTKRLRAGDMSSEEIALVRKNHKALAPLLVQAMRDEANELREEHPEAPPDAWQDGFVLGPAVARYVKVMMQLVDDAEELDQARKEAYQAT